VVQSRQGITAWADGPAVPPGPSPAESQSSPPALWLGLATRDPDLGLGRSLWLMRSQGAEAFSAAEQRQFESLAGHLAHAQRISAFCIALLRAPGHHRPSGAKQGLALVDAQGVIRHANDVFLTHARQGFPDWQPPALPSMLALPALRLWTAIRRQSLVFTAQRRRPGGGLEVRSYQCCEGMACLTETEFRVAACLFAGASYKEVARELGLAPSTVTKHVNNLYPKLGIGHRVELANFFLG